MFEVGQLITKKEWGDYCVTTPEALCLVIRADERGTKVEVVAHNEYQSGIFTVDGKLFRECSYEEFMEEYPNAHLAYGYTAEQLKAINKKGKRKRKWSYG